MDVFSSLLAYLAIALVLAAAAPTALVFCARADRQSPGLALALSMTIAVAFGGLSLLMLLMQTIGLPLWPADVLVLYLLAALPGALWWWRKDKRLLPALTISRDAWLPLALCGLVCAAVLLNAINLPFFRDDALGIYQPQALEIARMHALIPLTGSDSLYRAYPMLAQMNYAWAYMLAGWQHDYAAKLMTTLLAVASVPAAFALVAESGRKTVRAGAWLAALMIVTAPTFASWASSGYVDLPMGTFLVLTLVYLARLWRDGHPRDAAVAGLMFGLACWTKNNALILIPSLLAALVVMVLARRIPLRTAVLTFCFVLVVTAPWYVRNLFGAGFLLPDTTWVEQAERTLTTLFVFISTPNNFLLTGWLVSAALALAPLAWLHHRAQAYPELLILIFAGPFFAGWWMFASYDERFLVAILPMLAALAGLVLPDVLTGVWPRRVMRLGALSLAVALCAYCAFIAVQYKDELAREPFMSDADRRSMVGRSPDSAIPAP